MNPFKKIYNKVFNKPRPDSKKKYVYHKTITPAGMPMWDRKEGRLSSTETNPDSYNAIIKPSSEVIEPEPSDTAESICMKMSQAAVDKEFPRIIVYPIESTLREEVLHILREQENAKVSQVLKAESDDLPTEVRSLAIEEGRKHREIRRSRGVWVDPPKYPMYEYAEANLVGKDDLNSKTIIFKYRRY